MQIAGIGPRDFHGDDVALARSAARVDMNLAVYSRRIARRAA